MLSPAEFELKLKLEEPCDWWQGIWPPALVSRKDSDELFVLTCEHLGPDDSAPVTNTWWRLQFPFRSCWLLHDLLIDWILKMKLPYNYVRCGILKNLPLRFFPLWYLGDSGKLQTSWTSHFIDGRSQARSQSQSMIRSDFKSVFWPFPLHLVICLNYYSSILITWVPRWNTGQVPCPGVT